MTLRRLIAIVGPTAAGKSSMAVQLAERLGGEIVNADSRQVYRGMEIGTAQPDAEARRFVRHHLYGTVDPLEGYSLASYVRDATAALDEIWSKGSFAWLVGGTGQYVWALLEAWTVPEVPPDEALRKRLAALAESEGAPALHERLARVDPVAAERIDPANVRRVIRALEVYEHTGRPISEWQRKGEPSFEYLLYGVDLPNDVLEARIAARTENMFRSGLVDEVRRLREHGVRRDMPAMGAIGYAQAWKLLEDEIDEAQAIEETALATRQLVRRQRQWFRKDDAPIRWVRDADDIEMESNIFTGACTNVIRRPR